LTSFLLLCWCAETTEVRITAAVTAAATIKALKVLKLGTELLVVFRQ
jgi:hypothetical protein